MVAIMTRFAIYFAPSSDSLWHLRGAHWFGYDPFSGEHPSQLSVAGISSARLRTFTHDAAQYGFHATLKAPFVLADDASESELLQMAKMFAAEQVALPLHGLTISQIGHFLAINTRLVDEDVNTLAMRCVRYFEPLRAPNDAATLTRRRGSGLSERQEVLLQRWGYPYTEEEFRFHMSLTGSLKQCDRSSIERLREAAEQHFLTLQTSEPLIIDALCIFRQEDEHHPFICWHRLPFLPFLPLHSIAQTTAYHASQKSM